MPKLDNLFSQKNYCVREHWRVLPDGHWFGGAATATAAAADAMTVVENDDVILVVAKSTKYGQNIYILFAFDRSSNKLDSIQKITDSHTFKQQWNKKYIKRH